MNSLHLFPLLYITTFFWNISRNVLTSVWFPMSCKCAARVDGQSSINCFFLLNFCGEVFATKKLLQVVKEVKIAWASLYCNEGGQSVPIQKIWSDLGCEWRIGVWHCHAVNKSPDVRITLFGAVRWHIINMKINFHYISLVFWGFGSLIKSSEYLD